MSGLLLDRAGRLSINAAPRSLVRRSKGGRRREVGMDAWGWDSSSPALIPGAKSRSARCVCIINGASCADDPGHASLGL